MNLQSKERLDQRYWEDRYQSETTGWDIGYPSTPLKAYFDQLENKELGILIPGAGNAYEAAYLWEHGFKNVDVLDISISPLQAFSKRCPSFPNDRLIHCDFFQHNKSYDLVVEQTFFCALDPQLRSAYVAKMCQLLNPKGKLIGLLWNKPMSIDQPPFGGTHAEYERLFDEKFDIEIMELAYNSIPPRQGNELFVKLVKKYS